MPVAARYKALAALEPQATQRNSLDRLQTGKHKLAPALLIQASTTNSIRLACYLSA
jgi:hypothetical protein